VLMARTAVLLNIDEKRVISALQEAGKILTAADGETVLDFSSVRRIDATALRALEEFAESPTRKRSRSCCAASASTSTRCSSW